MALPDDWNSTRKRNEVTQCVPVQSVNFDECGLTTRNTRERREQLYRDFVSHHESGGKGAMLDSQVISKHLFPMQESLGSPAFDASVGVATGDSLGHGRRMTPVQPRILSSGMFIRYADSEFVMT
jgi:hypothetical protein